MLTFKEYAKSRGISYEAVRQSIKRHNDEIADHISKQGRTQYLDDIAIQILDKYRTKNNVTIYEPTEDHSETVAQLTNQIILLQQRIIELQSESTIGIEARAKLELIEAENKSLSAEVEQLRAETGSYQRTIFGLYKKVKSQ